MSAEAIWTVHCSGALERSKSCLWWIGEEWTRTDAERLARSKGWVVGRQRGTNLCPACKAVS